MKLEQAARQALNWIDANAPRYVFEAIEEALAEQAEQEPVAWLWVSEHGSKRLEWEPVEDTSKWKSTPLYAAPVRTKDLTDDEIKEIWSFGNGAIYFARAVIAADREKNR